MNKKIKSIISIFIPLIVGGISALLSGGFNSYGEMVKPSFAPPSIIFPIVWSILFLLMGISYYLCNKDKYFYKSEAWYLYIFQLVINFLWTIIFFRFKLYFLSFIWIVGLLISIILMTKEMYKYNKIASYLQVPYILWVSFATILTYAVYILN